LRQRSAENKRGEDDSRGFEEHADEVCGKWEGLRSTDERIFLLGWDILYLIEGKLNAHRQRFGLVWQTQPDIAIPN